MVCKFPKPRAINVKTIDMSWCYHAFQQTQLRLHVLWNFVFISIDPFTLFGVWCVKFIMRVTPKQYDEYSYHIQYKWGMISSLNTLRPRQNGRHFADDIFKCISLNENICNSLNVLLNLVPKVRINNIPSLVQIVAWRRSGDKPLSEPMIVTVLTHICVTRLQWVSLKKGTVPILDIFPKLI